jgi:hypothetical protein
MTYNSKFQDDFYDMFQGYPDAFGTDSEHGVRAVRGSAYDAVGRHLDGGPPCGIYPMNNNMVKWGCTDIDNGSFQDAQTMHDILHRMGMPAWIELSRSKGYHVWVFGAEFMPAWYMRRAFLFAHHVSEKIGKPVPPSEVNPKSEWLEDSQLGNFVRVPYLNGEADENGRRVMVTWDHEPIPLGEFLTVVKGDVVPINRVRSWAERYAPPKPRHSTVGSEPSEDASELAKRLTGLGYRIFRDGPPEWNPRRSNAMAKLARECAISGLTPDEAYVIISDLDERLQKWTEVGVTADGHVVHRSAANSERARWSCVEWGYNNV